MTDDEIDRLLFALPLEEPPADLRGRILAATVARPPVLFAPWELWVLGTALALAVWLTVGLLGAQPDPAVRIAAAAAGALRALLATGATTCYWLAVGALAAWTISQLTLMPRRPAPMMKR